MKFRLALILALLLGAAALSGLTARVHITLSAPMTSDIGYVNAYYAGHSISTRDIEVTLPNPMGREVVVDITLSDDNPARTVCAKLTIDNQNYFTSAFTVWPVSDLYFNL